MEHTGRVVVRTFAPGSKSEHQAVWLVTDGGEYRLVRAGGNPFYDEQLHALQGRRVRCRGEARGGTLAVTECHEIHDGHDGDGPGVDAGAAHPHHPEG